jgi:hypothetical protein
MKRPTLWDNAHPIVDITYKKLDSKYTARRPCLSDSDAQSNGYFQCEFSIYVHICKLIYLQQNPLQKHKAI